MRRNVATLVFRDETDTNTYQTWWTVSVRDGGVYVLTNMGGNGQAWERIGSYCIVRGRMAFSLWERSPAARLFACALSSVGYSVHLPGGFPRRLPQGYFCFPPQRNARTGRELTAWDSVAAVHRGERPRDKNRNREREKVSEIDLSAEMAKRSGRG